MSTKDYVKIACAFAKANRNDDTAKLAYAIAQVLKADNERFQYSKFLKACGYPVE